MAPAYWIRADLTDAQGIARHCLRRRSNVPGSCASVTMIERSRNESSDRSGHSRAIPLMFMNAKIDPINVKITGGLSKTIRVKADVGRRGFEADWFAEFEGRLVSVLGLGPEVAVRRDGEVSVPGG